MRGEEYGRGGEEMGRRRWVEEWRNARKDRRGGLTDYMIREWDHWDDRTVGILLGLRDILCLNFNGPQIDTHTPTHTHAHNYAWSCDLSL